MMISNNTAQMIQVNRHPLVHLLPLRDTLRKIYHDEYMMYSKQCSRTACYQSKKPSDKPFLMSFVHVRLRYSEIGNDSIRVLVKVRIEDASMQVPEKGEVTIQESHTEQQLPVPSASNQALSTFYVEPAPVAIDNAFDTAFLLNDNGDGSSKTRADSTYDSLCRNSDSFRHECPSSQSLLTANTDSVHASLIQKNKDDCAMG